MSDPAARGKCHVPVPVLKQVHRQNLEFLHTRAHFSYPYFQFMRQLLVINYSFTKSQIDFNASAEALVSQSSGTAHTRTHTHQVEEREWMLGSTCVCLPVCVGEL